MPPLQIAEEFSSTFFFQQASLCQTSGKFGPVFLVRVGVRVFIRYHASSCSLSGNLGKNVRQVYYPLVLCVAGKSWAGLGLGKFLVLGKLIFVAGKFIT